MIALSVDLSRSYKLCTAQSPPVKRSEESGVKCLTAYCVWVWQRKHMYNTGVLTRTDIHSNTLRGSCALARPGMNICVIQRWRQASK